MLEEIEQQEDQIVILEPSIIGGSIRFLISRVTVPGATGTSFSSPKRVGRESHEDHTGNRRPCATSLRSHPSWPRPSMPRGSGASGPCLSSRPQVGGFAEPHGSRGAGHMKQIFNGEFSNIEAAYCVTRLMVLTKERGPMAQLVPEPSS